MAIFEKALEILLTQEGGLCVDTGGVTNFGITVPVLQEVAKNIIGLDVDCDGDIDADDIRKLTVSIASRIYRIQWWDRYSYEKIDDQIIATHILSFSVNMGPMQGHKIIQRALRSVGRCIKDDGWIGSVTLSNLNSVHTCELLPAIRSEAAGFYRGLVMMNPVKFGPYLEGWLNRAYA